MKIVKALEVSLGVVIGASILAAFSSIASATFVALTDKGKGR